MPKKVSTGRAVKSRTNTSTTKTKKKNLVAETDTDWGKLASTQTISPSPWVATQKEITDQFPYETFPFRIDVKSQGRVCWFECEEHMTKLIEREKLNEKDYKISTNGVALVGKITRSKGRKK